MNFLFLKSYDNEDWPILETHFATLKAYVDAALASDPSARVLMGWNRSAALAIAYACATTGRAASTVIEEARAASSLDNHLLEYRSQNMELPRNLCDGQRRHRC